MLYQIPVTIQNTGETTSMFNPKLIDEVSKQLFEAIPSPIRELNENLQKNFRAILTSVFEKLDLVTREEFDAQVRVLHRTLERLEVLEKSIEIAE